MKEFERWWNKPQNIEEARKETGHLTFATIDEKVDGLAKTSWKAALEWVLKQDPGFCACGAMNVIYDGEEYKPTLFDVIQQELREE